VCPSVKIERNGMEDSILDYIPDKTKLYKKLVRGITRERLRLLRNLKPTELKVGDWYRHIPSRGGYRSDKDHIILPCVGVTSYEGAVVRHKDCELLYEVSPGEMWRFPVCPDCMTIKARLKNHIRLQRMREDLERIKRNVAYALNKYGVNSKTYVKEQREFNLLRRRYTIAIGDAVDYNAPLDKPMAPNVQTLSDFDKYLAAAEQMKKLIEQQEAKVESLHARHDVRALIEEKELEKLRLEQRNLVEKMSDAMQSE